MTTTYARMFQKRYTTAAATLASVTLESGEFMLDLTTGHIYCPVTGGSGFNTEKPFRRDGMLASPTAVADNEIPRWDGTDGYTTQPSGLKILDGSAGSLNPTGSKTLVWTASVTLAGTDGKTLTINDTAAISGTNTGDQTITLTGDVTGSGTASFAATIANGAVTLAKMADMATSSLIYRKTAGSGAPEVNTLATLKTDLGLTGTNSGDQTITLTGDVTGSGTGSFAATIANDAVTYAKMQNVSATDKLLGRATAGAGDVEEITCTAFGRSLIDDAAAGNARATLGVTQACIRVVKASFGDGTNVPATLTVVYAQAPVSGTITKATIDSENTTSSATVDIWKDTDANYPPTVADTIVASAKPTLSSANKSSDSTLAGWTTTVTAGDWLAFRLDTVSGATRVNVQLEITTNT